MSRAKKPKRIDLNQEEINALMERVSNHQLRDDDYELIRALIDTLRYLGESVDQKSQSIKKLLQMIFGSSTETKENIFGAMDKTKDNASDQNEEDDPESPAGHGKNGADDYTGAEKICVDHESLKSGDLCPKCGKGKVYEKKNPKILIRLTGNPPISGKIYELQKFRCNLCGETFTAKAPESVGEEKYDSRSVAMMVLLRYGTGMPLNRLEKLQNSLGIPLPASTQWETAKNNAHAFYPVMEWLLDLAAQGDIIHNDDTPAKILSLIKEIQEKMKTAGHDPPHRKGMFTTGIVSKSDQWRIALFATGRQHAGENLEALLKRRREETGPPIQMCDGLSRNRPGDFEIILSNCLTHARRKFVDVIEKYPVECQHVIDVFAKVYHNDAIAKKQNMSPEQRLGWHKQKSAHILDELNTWMQELFDKKIIEPNSILGNAIQYTQKRWLPLTLFLRKAGAPLDNNICEQALKKVVLSRKNSYFYKTPNGARIADLFMSLIHTCELSGADPFDYLTAILDHRNHAEGRPSDWMPWNYTDTVGQLG